MKAGHAQLSVWTVALLVAASACNPQPQAPLVEDMEPNTAVQGESLAVTIHGKFYLDAHVSERDASRSRLGATFSAFLGNVALEEVEYVDFERLTARVPTTLEVGLHDLTVEGPAGRAGTLARAFTIMPQEDHISIEDAPDGLGTEIGDVALRVGQMLSVYAVSRRGDGTFIEDTEGAWSVRGNIGAVDMAFGQQALFTATAVGSGSIVAESNAYGSDESGVISITACTEHSQCVDPCHSLGTCVDGGCVLGAVDKDIDGDGLLDGLCPGGSDCDDNKPNCTTDCTDSDGDGYCLPVDCDDTAVTGSACNVGCSTYYHDADGDLYGDPLSSVTACQSPAEYVADNTDCADIPTSDLNCNGLDGSLCNPGLTGLDVCDGADNDCDTLTDEDAVCGEPWWDPLWGNRTVITFDNRASAEDLTDFPVLMSLNTTNLPSLDLSAVVGADVRFTDATTGAELKYEIEAWDAAADTATVWVKVPQIDSSSNTDYIWVYYNYDGVATYDQLAVDEEAVWDDNFMGVWHLEEPVIDEQTSGTHDDSTGVNDGAQRNNAAATGKIAGGQHFDGSDYIDIDAVADDIDVTVGTFSTWVQLDPMNSLGVILSTYPDPDEFIEIRWWEPNDEVSHKYRIPSVHTDVANSVYDDTSDVWHYATLTWDTTGSELKAYTDGVQIGTTLGMAGPIVTALSDGAIGARGDNVFGMKGDIDEVRISGTVRSADWIEASFLSQNGIFTFNTFGSEEAAP
ncbi:DUF2341 domain-containing protein [Myxococcota bacterium]